MTVRRLPLYQAVVVCFRDLGMEFRAIATAYRLTLDQVDVVLREALGKGMVRR